MHWLSAPVQPLIAVNVAQVHLWLISLDRPVQADWDCLQADEVERAARFRFEGDRDRFVQSRSSLRHILSRYLNRPPADVAFAYSHHGKPHCPQTPDLSFNLSHSGSMALCAIAQGHRIGVDIEQYRDLSHFEALSRRCLLPAEQMTLNQLPAAQAQAQFFRYWTCKEAYLKAIGCGLTQALTSVSVQLQPPRLLHVPEAGTWQLTTLQLDDYAAAVVSETAAEVIGYQFNSP